MSPKTTPKAERAMARTPPERGVDIPAVQKWARSSWSFLVPFFGRARKAQP